MPMTHLSDNQHQKAVPETGTINPARKQSMSHSLLKTGFRKNLVPNCGNCVVPNCMSGASETDTGFQRRFLVHVSLALNSITVAVPTF